jgi:hypothetical protein
VSALKDCPVEGCQARIARQLLVCRVHWRLVPPDLKREVWRAYQNGEGILHDAYRRAAAAAVDAAERAEARRAA